MKNYLELIDVSDLERIAKNFVKTHYSYVIKKDEPMKFFNLNDIVSVQFTDVYNDIRSVALDSFASSATDEINLGHRFAWMQSMLDVLP